MKKIGIVILNYLNYSDTIECVDSLKKQTNQNFEIVIVDNYSKNESFKVLSELYKKEKKIHVLKTETNLGYAKGNNAGIRFCKEKLGIFNVLIVNNDVIFYEEDYIDYFLKTPFDKNIGAIGTKIIGSDGKNQNPVYTPITTKRVLKDAIYFTLEKWDILKFYTFLKTAFNKSILNNQEKSVAVEDEDEDEKKEGKYILHGSAIFLTDNYLNQMEGFYPKTFLYYEENILAIIMEKLDLKMIYTDNAEIYHKEDQSSALSFGNDSKIFRTYLVDSMWIAVKVKFSSIKRIKETINREWDNRYGNNK
ncbi:glycosyltransferase [Pisciglobus halotolerans]|uniref:Glycosyltransferase, GT2 family n=1 Tax=Pisciglobus halotolerans TaxID=745365 RepID=A0A1I3CQ59_9LACT|nr:glycosyltransferase [Pisciglobus halotolerans]SFH76488.1 Glycosyltransferase, GT2 family [Pisciglobus halotolerans]